MHGNCGIVCRVSAQPPLGVGWGGGAAWETEAPIIWKLACISVSFALKFADFLTSTVTALASKTIPATVAYSITVLAKKLQFSEDADLAAAIVLAYKLHFEVDANLANAAVTAEILFSAMQKYCFLPCTQRITSLCLDPPSDCAQAHRWGCSQARCGACSRANAGSVMTIATNIRLEPSGNFLPTPSHREHATAFEYTLQP